MIIKKGEKVHAGYAIDDWEQYGDLTFLTYFPELEYPYICIDDSGLVRNFRYVIKVDEYIPHVLPKRDWIGRHICGAKLEGTETEIFAICKKEGEWGVLIAEGQVFIDMETLCKYWIWVDSKLPIGIKK